MSTTRFAFSRRRLLPAAFALPFAMAAPAPKAMAAPAPKKEERHRFRAAGFDIELSLRYHDAYSSRGFRFHEEGANREFCLSSHGEQNRMCLENFHGSLVLARYRVRALAKHAPLPGLREYVRTIDRDTRLEQRPPFERAIELDGGVASDVQAFGYEAPDGTPPLPPAHGPWYLLRQDLFLEPQKEPFLVLYWKQALPSIRILDMIPGEQTSVLER